jgi:hypothetical protein
MVSSKARRGSVLLAGAMLAIAASTVACAAVFGFERLSEEGAAETGTPEASAADGPATIEGGPQCAELGIPAKPGPVDAGSDAPDAIHVGLKLLDLGIDPNAAPAGFNLDKVCSPTTATSSCATSIDEATWTKYGADKGDQGIDNAGAALLSYLGFLGSAFSPTEINNRLQAGEHGLVVRISDYNGMPEDDEVIVELFPAMGVWQQTDAGVVAGGKPTFTSKDQWMRDRRFQNVVDASRIKSAGGYVTGGRLVASFQTVTIALAVPDDKKPFDFLVQEAYLTADLSSPDGTTWKLSNGVVGGRAKTSDFLSQVRTIYVLDTAGLKNVVLCDPGLKIDVYGAVKKEICDGRDIRSASRQDSQGQPCDAFSAALRFDTYALDSPGAFADLPTIAPRCQKDGGVPEKDDCAPAFP